MKGNNEDEKAKCPICGKSHLGTSGRVGDNIGNSGNLATNLEGPENDALYHGLNSLAAHHLISSGLISGEKVSSDDKEYWEKVCHAYGYDINHKKNGLFCTTIMRVACARFVPLHLGPHGGGRIFTEQGDIVANTRYPKEVEKKLNSIKQQIDAGNACKDPDGLIALMNDESQDIKDKILSFTWTITTDGRDYMAGGIGCCDCVDIPSKRKKARAYHKLLFTRGTAQDKLQQAMNKITDRCVTRSHSLDEADISEEFRRREELKAEREAAKAAKATKK